jgi:hypothetical protein
MDDLMISVMDGGRWGRTDVARTWTWAGFGLAGALFTYAVYRLLTVEDIAPEWRAWSLGCLTFSVFVAVAWRARRGGHH